MGQESPMQAANVRWLVCTSLMRVPERRRRYAMDGVAQTIGHPTENGFSPQVNEEVNFELKRLAWKRAKIAKSCGTVSGNCFLRVFRPTTDGSHSMLRRVHECAEFSLYPTRMSRFYPAPIGPA